LSKINWTADRWFADSFAFEITDEFKAWWVKYYGSPSAYTQESDEQDEYWVRCSFAWAGWKAAIDYLFVEKE
jgi:hypothetical protein